MLSVYSRDHLDGICLMLKTDLGCSDVSSKLVARRSGDLGEKWCKKQFTPEKSLKVPDNCSKRPWRASWSGEYQNTWADDVSPKAAFLLEGGASHQKGAKCGGDDILFSHHCHCYISAQPRVTAPRELQGGIQFKLHIYWLSSQPLVSIICFRYQIYWWFFFSLPLAHTLIAGYM